MTVLLIGAGGFLGAIARYLVDLAVTSTVPGRFPVGILLVNVTGAFLLGLLSALTGRALLPETIRGPVFVGFIGAYTTFSTFMLDSWRLAENGWPVGALVNLVASVGLGLVAVVLGLAIGRAL